MGGKAHRVFVFGTWCEISFCFLVTCSLSPIYSGYERKMFKKEIVKSIGEENVWF
jgi:hypothetical protein